MINNSRFKILGRISIYIIIFLMILALSFYGGISNGKNEKNINSKKEIVNTDIYNEINKADQLFYSKNYSGAIDIYEKILKEGKYNGKMLINLFVSYVSTQEFNKGLNVLYLLISASGPKEELVGFYIKEDNLSDNIVNNQKIIKESGKNVDSKILLEQAKLLYKAGDYYYEKDKNKYYIAIMLHYLSSYELIDNALQLDSNNSELYYYQGCLLMDIGGFFPVAQVKLEQAIKLKKDDYKYYYKLGNAYSEQKKYELAIESYKNGINLNNNYEKLYLNIGNTYISLGKIKEGFDNYDKGIKICHEMCDGFYNNIGNEYFDKKEYKNAAPRYEKALEFNPNHQNAKKNLNIIESKIQNSSK